MIICSKFVCSKNLLDTILLLLDTIRAFDKKSEKWLTIKNICRTCISSSFTFIQKKYQLLKLQMVDKGFGKCQLLDTIYCKENGVHVRQLG